MCVCVCVCMRLVTVRVSLSMPGRTTQHIHARNSAFACRRLHGSTETPF